MIDSNSPPKVFVTISELKELPISSINFLREVINSYEYIISRIQNCRLYKVFIVIRSNEGFVDFLIVIKNPDGSIQYKCQRSIKNDNCPLLFIRQLEEAKANNQILDGYPFAVLIISKEVRDYIVETGRKRSGRKKFSQLFSYLSRLICQ